MVFFNYALRKLNAKIVYYGPGLCGKTTNLQYIYEKTNPNAKGKLISLATETDRTLFFYFLPLDLGTIRGFTTRFHLYTVPGQVFYDASRKLILKGVDGAVFVADSQIARIDANEESFENLQENLQEYGLNLQTLPHVIQYNKRDLPTALPVSVLNARLNPRNLPFFEAVALEGRGVEDTLRGISQALFRSLLELYGEEPGAEAATVDTAAPPAATPGATVPARGATLVSLALLAVVVGVQGTILWVVNNRVESEVDRLLAEIAGEKDEGKGGEGNDADGQVRAAGH